MIIDYFTKDELVANLLFMYCESKSAIWRFYWGWKKTTLFGWHFQVSKKAARSAEKWASTIRKTKKSS